MIPGKRVLLTTACLIALAYAPFLHAQEWTRFRGPNGSGISEAKTVPVKWTDADYKWKIDLPGIGHSSPVVWGHRLFVTTADAAAGKRSLLCIDTGDGSTLWTKDFGLKKFKTHKNNSLASGTPTVDADHVYVLWQSPTTSPLIAYDHEGNKKWEYDLGPYKHGQGPGTSPIIYQDLVIVSNDHKNDSFLLAVDRRNGKERWKIPREGKRACYATPCVYRPSGRPDEIIFSHCFEGIVGVNPQTGKQLWMIDVFGTFPQRAVGSPVIAGDLIIGNSGARVGDKNLVAIRPKTTSGGIEVEEAYRVSKTAPHVPTPLVYGKWVFLWNDSGVVTCITAEDGKKVWQKRVGGAYFSSPICIDGKLYCVDLEGTVVVLAASDQYEVLARNPLGETSHATPAVSGGILFVRTNSKLFAIGGK